MMKAIILAMLPIFVFGAVPVKWTVETSRVAPVRIDAYHGETLELEATLLTYGRPVTGVTTASFLWQTRNMGQSWWQTNATCSAGVARATFTPNMDVGQKDVSFFISCADAAGGSYRASGSINFRTSPGARPSIAYLPQPTGTIDFAQVTVLNAPWCTLDAAQGAIDAAVQGPYTSIASLSNNVYTAIAGVRGEIPSIAGLATTGEVATAIAGVRGEIPSIAGLATTGEVATAIAGVRGEIPSVAGLATTGEVATAIAGVRGEIPSVSGLATHGEVATSVATGVATVRVEVPGITSNVVTRQYVEDLGISGGGGGGVNTNAVRDLIAEATNDVFRAANTNYFRIAYNEIYPEWTNVGALGLHGKIFFPYHFDGQKLGFEFGDAYEYSTGLHIYGDGEEGTVAFSKFNNTTTLIVDGSNVVTSNILDEATSEIRQTVAGWETYWRGDRVRLSVTNYYGNTSGEPPRLRIEESETNGAGTVVGWRTVWDETTRQTNTFAKIDNISNVVMVAAYRQTANQLGNKAPRAWQEVTSAGESAPPNTVWHTSANTVFAGGTEYAHVSTGEGVVCVLVDKGAATYTAGEAGVFRFQDDSGQNYFGFDVKSAYTIGCNTDDIDVQTVGSNKIISLTYDLTSATNPDILHTTNLTGAVWTPATVEWEQNPPVGQKVAYINAGTNPCGFYKATISSAGGSKFVTNMQADLQGGIAASNEVNHVMQSIYPVITSTGVVWRVRQ